MSNQIQLFLLTLLLFSCAPRCFGDEPSNKELAMADELIAKFLSHRDAHDRFAVSGRFQIVRQDDAAAIEERWCASCEDVRKDLHRFDEIRWHSSSSGVVKANDFSIFYEGKVISSFRNSLESEKRFDLEEEEKDGKPKRFGFPIIKITPFEHMFASGITGRPEAARLPSILSRLATGAYKVVTFKETPETYSVLYLWHEVRGIEIVYNRRKADLPVRVNYVDLTNDKTIYSTMTNWGRHGKSWLPQKIFINSLSPERKVETTIELRWVLGDSLPDNVFVPGTAPTASELRDLIEENAVLLRE